MGRAVPTPSDGSSLARQPGRESEGTPRTAYGGALLRLETPSPYIAQCSLHQKETNETGRLDAGAGAQYTDEEFCGDSAIGNIGGESARAPSASAAHGMLRLELR